MKRTIALLTIGRSPRPDIRADIESKLGGRFQIVESGALDRASDAEIAKMTPTEPDDALLASIGGDQQATVSKKTIAEQLRTEVARLDHQIDVAVILCTGIFPPLGPPRKVAQVGQLLMQAARDHGPVRCLGVMVPIEEQADLNKRLWSDHAQHVVTAVASPYQGTSGIIDSARQLSLKGAELIVMSCMTYSEAMRRAVSEATSRPTVAPSQALVDFLNEEWGEHE
jgi:protein AroM